MDANHSLMTWGNTPNIMKIQCCEESIVQNDIPCYSNFLKAQNEMLPFSHWLLFVKMEEISLLCFMNFLPVSRYYI